MDPSAMSVRMREWAAIIQEAASCGLTKTEFCAQKGINRRQFFHWQKKLRDYVLEQNPDLGIPPARGHMQEIRAVNSQIMSSLPVFCELKPQEELPSVPSAHPVQPVVQPAARAQPNPEKSFSAGAMIQLGEYKIYVSNAVSEKMLSTIMTVIRHA